MSPKREENLAQLGIRIPEVPKPVAAYVPAVQSGSLLFTSGQLPFVDGKITCQGKVGAEVSVEEAQRAARACALNCLGAARSLLGSLDRIVRVVKVVGFVQSAPGFSGQPQVVNGASELFLELLGDDGRHARSAVGVTELPHNAAVEVEAVFEVG
ncbi:MAG: RidA family protein [Bacillota bacterium]